MCQQKNIRRCSKLRDVTRPTPTSPKQQWRKWAKEVRSNLEPDLISEQVVEHLTSWYVFKKAEHILMYLAFGSEISLEALTKQEKTFYVTRTWETDHDLTLHRLDGGLEPHPYGYAQPIMTSSEVNPEKIDLALVPGLCFDEMGTRLGYGRGYYDRLLPKLRPDVPLVGVIANALIVPELPKDLFDIPMIHLVSERGVARVFRG